MERWWSRERPRQGNRQLIPLVLLESSCSTYKVLTKQKRDTLSNEKNVPRSSASTEQEHCGLETEATTNRGRRRGYWASRARRNGGTQGWTVVEHLSNPRDYPQPGTSNSADIDANRKPKTFSCGVCSAPGVERKVPRPQRDP